MNYKETWSGGEHHCGKQLWQQLLKCKWYFNTIENGNKRSVFNQTWIRIIEKVQGLSCIASLDNASSPRLELKKQVHLERLGEECCVVKHSGWM